MTLLIAYGLLALGVSFFCSLLEASLLSLPRSQVELLVQSGSRVGRSMQTLKDNVDRPLAAILTLNTIAHTVGAAGVGAQAAVIFGDAAVGIASAVMTVAILVFSEIIPKTLGAVHAKSLVGLTTRMTQAMIILTMPLIIILEWINRVVGYERHHDLITRAEVLATIRLGEKGGSLGARERRIVLNLLTLSNVRVEDIMTPRTVVFALQQDMTASEVLAKHVPIRFARIPVFETWPDRVTGYVHRFEIHRAVAQGRTGATLASLSQPLVAIPEMASVADAFEQLLGGGEHIALAVDEYGGVSGILTLEDVLETMLGQEIVDETDVVADMRDLAYFRRPKHDAPGGLDL